MQNKDACIPWVSQAGVRVCVHSCVCLQFKNGKVMLMLFRYVFHAHPLGKWKSIVIARKSITFALNQMSIRFEPYILEFGEFFHLPQSILVCLTHSSVMLPHFTSTLSFSDSKHKRFPLNFFNSFSSKFSFSEINGIFGWMRK